MNKPPPSTKIINGFTLAEVMLTLAIIAILAAVALPLYQTYSTRARVSEALVFADAARTRVDLALFQGAAPDPGALNARADMITRVQWVPAAATTPNGALGFILVEMKLPGLGDAPVNALALLRMSQGAWICTSAAKVAVPDAKVLPLEEKYLPATCHGDGSALAAPLVAGVPPCPPDQDMVTLTSAGKSSSACTPKCAAGQTRDAANPTQCSNPSVAYMPSAPVLPSQPATTSVATAKPAAVALAASAAANSGTAAPTAAVPPPRQCHVCDPSAPPELCQQLTIETTCAYPKNYCMTEVNNHADGSKDVRRYCGSYEDMYREWWQGTSDDDKCRVIDGTVTEDVRCTFGCETPNCNQAGGTLRPPEDVLFHDK